MEVVLDETLLKELVDHALNPPGSDPVLGAFYATWVDMIKEEHLSKMLIKVKKRRSDITTKHLVNLIYRAYQSIKFQQKDFSFRNLRNSQGWRKELQNTLSDARLRSRFEKILSTKSTSTTIYQRYAGPFGLITHFWGNLPVTIADLGCGGNYGLRGLDIGAPHKEITDQTPSMVVLSLLSKKINLKKGLAFDKEHPDHPQVRQWRLACSFYPKELAALEEVIEFENKIQKSTRIEFFQANLLSAPPLPQKSCEAVILSMILYQLSPREQSLLMKNARKLLKAGGILIIQDFAVKSLSQKRLNFNTSWFGKKFSFKTFVAANLTNWNLWEVFQWENGRCLKVRAGEDFRKVFPLKTRPHSKTARAALAHATS